MLLVLERDLFHQAWTGRGARMPAVKHLLELLVPFTCFRPFRGAVIVGSQHLPHGAGTSVREPSANTPNRMDLIVKLPKAMDNLIGSHLQSGWWLPESPPQC